MELKSIKLKTIRFPKELERQESDPYYSLLFYYNDDSVESIRSTETGKFYFRMLDNSGWVGGAK